MTVIIQLVNKLNSLNELCEKLKTAEKAETIEIKAEAEALFKSCYAEYRATQDTINNIGNGDKQLAELHVLVAETAFRTENYTVCRKVLEKLLQFEPQLDHFYCRAKVLLGLLINHECRHMNGNESIKWHKYAVAELMVALDVCVNPKNVNRYKFMIFNISVAFWKIVHPYLRPNRAKFFAAEIKRVVNALEKQNDSDKDWRIMFLSAAAVCTEDEKSATSVTAATELMDKAIEHADALLQLTLTEEERLNGILKEASAEKDRIMIAFRAIEEQEILRNKPKKIDPDAPPDDPNVPPEPRVLPPLTGLAAEGYDKVKALLEVSQARKAVADADLRVVVDRRNVQLEALLRLYQQRVSVNPTDAKRFSALPAVLKYPRASALVSVQCMLVNAIPDKEWEPTLTGLVKKLTDMPPTLVRNETLADMARAAWRLKLRQIAIQCCDLALQGNIVSKILKVKTDVCAALKALADVAQDNANQVTGSRLSIKQSEGFFTTKRIEGVKSLESALLACGKIENTQFLSQEICVTMWNAMIPLLVPHLRQRVHSALKSMATALRTVASPLAQLRMEVHAELAKCEDTTKAVESARDEALNAVNCDYGVLDKDASVNASNSRDGPSTIATAGVGALSPNELSLDRNRHLDHFILPYLNLLELRCLVYDSPADVEGQALLWLHQAKESKLKPFILDNVSKSLVLMMDLLCLNTPSKEEESGVEESKQELSNINQTLKRNAAGVIDFNALVASKGPVAIPPVPIEQLEKTLLIARTGEKYTQFTPVLQLHHRIMYSIVTLAHVLENVPLLQQAAMFVLRPVWDAADPFVRELIDAQVHVQYLLADNLVVRIQSVPFKRPVQVKDPLLEAAAVEEELSSEEVAARSVDPRCLGFLSDEVSAEIQSMKRMVVQYLEKGLAQAVLVKDIYALQNGIIFFWNLHVHLFRNGLYKYVIEDIPRFLVSAIAAVDSVLASLSATKATLPAAAAGAEPAPFDHRLRLSLLETLASYYESKGHLAEAVETTNKGAILAGAAPAGKPAKGAPVVEAAAPEVSEYLRKKICEQSSRLSLLQGASGAAGGKGAPKAGEPPVFGNVFLNVFAIIVQAEQPAQLMPKETAIVLVNKAVEQLEKDVEADLQMVDFVSLSQERFSQLLEMQVEAWTRLTRLRMLFGDTIGSQYTAEKCLALVSVTNLSKADEAFLSPRVWRWVSVCERFFGLAVAAIIQPTGQDLALQCDLRFVALDHFALACDNALRANNEQLVVDAATNAWNICTPLIDLTDLRTRLFPIQRRIVDDLNACKGVDPLVRSAVDKLRQQFYLAMIEGFANVHDWDNALKTVLEAFNYVSKELQKPLWQWRVITLSKKGKNVLDGIQKLKEGDPSLQAQVYGILARASSNPQQQLESYMKAIEILSVGLGQMERVDYMLELAQWMGSNGVPGADISTLVQTALDALYEVEEQSLPEDAFAAEEDEEGASERAESVAAVSVATKRTTATRTGQRGAMSATSSVRGLKSGAASTTRRGSNAASEAAPAGPKLGPDGKPIEEEKLPPRLDFKMLEQTARALIMQSMLESAQAKRTAKYLEAVYFIRKSLALWMDTLYFLYRKQAYAALRPEQRGEAPVAAAEPPAKGSKGAPVVEAAPEVIYATFESFEPPRPACLCPPEEPVLLVAWLATPSQQLVDLMVIATAQCADDVPSKQSLPAVQLSVHYLQVLADGLRACGHCKSALLVYSFCRMVLFYLTPVVTGTAAVLSAVHFQCVTLLMEMGLPTEALALPQSLPAGEFNTKLSPDEKPLINLTVGAYLVKYVVDTTAEGGKSLTKHEKVESKPISAFGFSTWTPAFTYAGGFDAPVYMLQVCDALLALGQVQQSHNLVLTVEKQFMHREDDRALVQTTSLLAKIALLNGRYEDSVSMILARREQMDRAGDAKELAMHTELLVQAYLKLDNADEARQVALLAMSLLEDVSLKMIDKNAIVNAAKQQSAANNNTLSKAGVTNSRTSISGAAGGTLTRTSTSMKSIASNRASNLTVEASVANVAAYVRVVRSFVALTLQETAQLIADHQDPRPLYVEMCEKLSRCVDLVSDVSGDVSLLVSEVLTLRATSAVELLVLLHQRASGVVTPGESYANWMRDNILMCVEHISRVVDFNAQLAQQVPVTELTYTSEKVVADARAASTDQIGLVPYKTISNPVVRLQALSQLQLASILVVQAVVSGDHVSRTVHDAFNAAKALSALTAVDKYLEVTKPPPTFDLNDFQLSGLTKAAQLLSECSRRLSGASVDPSGGLDVIPEVELLRSAALMLQQHRDGVFDCMWSQPYPLPAMVTHVSNADEKSITSEPANAATTIKAKAPGGKNTTSTAEVVAEPVVVPILMSPVGDIVLTADAKAAREALVTQTKKLLPKVSTLCASAGAGLVPSVKSLRYSCLALVEAFGQHRPATAAMWLLTLQSVQSSAWLRSVWREFSLNPTNAVAASLSRLEDLSVRTWPKKGSIQQILAEQEFLTNSSVPYKRLSFAADPLEIMRALPASLAVFCLQYCPVHNTLYACAGVRSPVVPVVAEKPAKGAPAAAAAPVASSEDTVKDTFWAIDKIELSETQRRALQVLLQQHKSWVAESTKFIATYGESAPTDCDLEGTTSKYESKNLRKAERALEEKLRALVADMESLLAPLLGPTSRVHGLLQVLTMGAEGAVPVLKEGSSSLLMLIDPTLQQLPWEALQLTAPFSGRVSRDFSLHMTHHRLQTLTAAATPAATGAANAAAAPTAGSAAINVSASAVRYVADPLREDEYAGSRMPGLQRKSITQAVQTLIQGNQSTTEEATTLLPMAPVVVPSAQKWVPVRSQNGTASLQDFIVSVDAATPSYAKTAGAVPVAPPVAEKPDKAAAAAAAAATAAGASSGAANSTLLVYTLGRVAGSLPPVDMASMDLQKLALFLCLDMGQNDTSNRRQMSADVLKTTRQIASEQPLVVSALSSLSGVGALLVHAWSTPINAQNRFLALFMQKFAASSPVAAAPNAAVPPMELGARTLLASVAAAGYTSAAPMSSATKSATASTSKHHRKSSMRSQLGSFSEDAMDTGRSLAEDSVDGSVAGSVAHSVAHSVAASINAAPALYPIKKWIRLARVVYGVPYITYSEV